MRSSMAKSLPFGHMLAGFLLSTSANAQKLATDAYPAQQAIDENGIDLITGQYNWESVPLVIGDGTNGLSAGRSLRAAHYRESFAINVYNQGVLTKVAFGGKTDEFLNTGHAPYVPVKPEGQSLVESNGIMVYTSSDGTIVTFAAGNYQFGNAAGRSVSEIVYPSKRTLTFTYDVIETADYQSGRRLKAVTNYSITIRHRPYPMRRTVTFGATLLELDPRTPFRICAILAFQVALPCRRENIPGFFLEKKWIFRIKPHHRARPKILLIQKMAYWKQLQGLTGRVRRQQAKATLGRSFCRSKLPIGSIMRVRLRK